MNDQIIQYLQSEKENIVQEWRELLKLQAKDRIVPVLSDQVFMSTSHEFIDLILSNYQNSGEKNAEKVERNAKTISTQTTNKRGD
jgi:rsbT co-antagonist protein RsbR